MNILDILSLVIVVEVALLLAAAIDLLEAKARKTKAESKRIEEHTEKF